MNTTTLLREARPRSAAHGADERAEHDLAEILGDEYAPPASPDRPRRIRPAVLVNVGVAALVVAASVLTIVLVGAAHPRPADSAAAAPRLFITPDDFVDATRGPLSVWRGAPLRIGVAPNGCITLGTAYLQAPKGSSLHGDELDLVGIGRLRIGDGLWSGTGGSVFWPGADTPYVRGSFTCGKGEYLSVGEASLTPPSTGTSTPDTSSTDAQAKARKTFRDLIDERSVDGRYSISSVVTDAGDAELALYGTVDASENRDLWHTPAIAFVAVGTFEWDHKSAPNTTVGPVSVLTRVVSLTNGAVLMTGFNGTAPDLSDLGVTRVDVRR